MRDFEFGIMGTSLQAALLAGLLVKKHKKTICLFTKSYVLERLPRQICLSFNLSTRPKTWEIQENTISEATTIITKIGGRHALERVNPIIVCKGKPGGQAMAHMYHLLSSNDYEIERLSKQQYPATSGAYKIRGAKIVHSQIMWPRLFKWLKTVGVEILDPEKFELVFRRNGSVLAKPYKKTDYDSNMIEMDKFILADEESIIAHARKKDIERLFIPIQTSAIIATASYENKEKLTLNPEYQFSAISNLNGGYKVLANAPLNMLGALMADFVDHHVKFHLQGKTTFNFLKPRDGAPVIGNPTPSSPWLLGGFGSHALFLTPAIARYIAQAADEQEMEYFTAHTASKKRNNKIIADYSGLDPGAD